jgi:lysophospholipase L1-like esterase
VLYVRRPHAPEVNALGFKGAEVHREKRPGLVRIACLGSSTTEGGNPSGVQGSYPHLLERALEAAGRPAEVLNFGMSGWTSAETLANYFLVVQDYAPDVVLLHEAVNDVEPRAWPGFRADYSHYRRPWRDLAYPLPYRLLLAWSDAAAALELRRGGGFELERFVVQPRTGPYAFENGRLPRGSEAPFRRNVRSIAEHVRLRGGRPVLVTLPYDPARAASHEIHRAGIDEHNAILRELAREHGFALVDLDALFRERPDAGGALFLDLVHVTPEGNRVKAQAIAKALLDAGLP